MNWAFVAALLKGLWEVLKPYIPELKGVVGGWILKDWLETKRELKEVKRADDVRKAARAVPDDERVEWMRKRGLLSEVSPDKRKPD